MNTLPKAQAEHPEWVGFLLEQFERHYLDDHGMMIINMNADGSADYAEPVIADFGDILPFLWHFDLHAFAESQLALAKQRLQQGLYVRDDRIRLFLNHDWLLGLIDLHRQSGDPELLSLAEQGADHIARRFFHGDLLIDEPARLADWRSWLAPVSPFNGGYIELWLDLYRFTDDPRHLASAEKLARGWTGTRDFIDHGLFARQICGRSAWVNSLLMKRSRLRVRVFKDNTNLCWGLLELYLRTGDDHWKVALEHWLTGFRRYLWNGGKVFLMLDAGMQGYNPSIKAAFSTLDLLCDLHDAGIQRDSVLEMAVAIADYWIGQRWQNGLFPEMPGGDADHLDANVDMVVGLAKLYTITHDARYLDVLTRCREAILEHHRSRFGYCQSVDRQGRPVDARIKIKYQGLLLKLALLPEDPSDLYRQPELLELLRDR